MTLDFDLRLRAHALGEWLDDQPTFALARGDARHPLAAGAVRPGRAHARRRRRAPRATPRTSSRRSTTWSSTAASCTCRSRGTTPPPARRSRRTCASVRDDAPWCPWNIEFIRRINGLDDVDAVRDIVFGAEYLVLGLGDVYLGAPVAVPVDPRHRLVTTKYNPARTWTPENAVGIGGAYLCIYGMEGPGGYQFVGRTVPVWSTYGRAAAHDRGRARGCSAASTASAGTRSAPTSCSSCAPTLRPVGSSSASRTAPSRAPNTARSLTEHAADIARLPDLARGRVRRRAGPLGSRRRVHPACEPVDVPAPSPRSRPRRARPTARSSWRHRCTACVARLLVSEGDRVAPGDAVVTLEAMKTESSVPSPVGGTVTRVVCEVGDLVTAGAPLLVVVADDVTSGRSPSTRCSPAGAASLAATARGVDQPTAPGGAAGAGRRGRRPPRRGGRAPPRGRTVRGEGQHRRRPHADHRRLPIVRVRARRERGGRAAPARCRRGLRGQDQPRPVRHRPGRHPVTAVRAVSQPRSCPTNRGRFELRARRSWSRRRGRVRARDRHRRFGTRPRRAVWVGRR